MRVVYIIRQCSASRRAVGSWGAPLAAAARNWSLSFAEGMGLSHILSFICPFESHAQPLQLLGETAVPHTSSRVASRTGIIAVVWRTRKLYIARLDKIFRLTQAQLLPDEAFAPGNPQKIGAGAFVLPSAGQQLACTYSDSREARAPGSSRRSVFYIVKQTVQLIKDFFFSFLF